jgi:hypothetical protein
MLQKFLLLLALIIIVQGNSSAKEIFRNKPKVIQTNVGEEGTNMEISFIKDKAFDHPTFAFWVEDADGKYIETLYVTNFLATGTYLHARLGEGEPKSKRGPAKRPSSLPYWLHKRNIRADGVTYLPTPDKPVPDAITSATPQNNFVLQTVCKSKLPAKYRVMMEINQPWDYNEFWNKDKFQGEFDYTYSCQPALVYSADIDMDNPQKEYTLSIIGHSHYSGKNGELFKDISTLTTAKDIVKQVNLRLK